MLRIKDNSQKIFAICNKTNLSYLSAKIPYINEKRTVTTKNTK